MVVVALVVIDLVALCFVAQLRLYLLLYCSTALLPYQGGKVAVQLQLQLQIAVAGTVHRTPEAMTPK